MIKWYLPRPSKISREKRMKLAYLAVRDNVFTPLDSNALYNAHLLLWERSEFDIMKRKYDDLQKKFIENSKELSKLKKAK